MGGDHNNLYHTGTEWKFTGGNYKILIYDTPVNDVPLDEANPAEIPWKLFISDGTTFPIQVRCTSSYHPTNAPTATPTAAPSSPSTPPTTALPSTSPTKISRTPTNAPSVAPTIIPTMGPTFVPSANPSDVPTKAPSQNPTKSR